MNSLSVQSCRACLLQDNVCNMYDLAVPEVLELYTQTSNVAVSIKRNSSLPQHLCGMCYRLCELIEGFRERCQESEKKLQRGEKMKRKISARTSSTRVLSPRTEIKTQLEEDDDAQDVKHIELDADPDTYVEGESVEVDANPDDTEDVLDQHGTHWDDFSDGDSYEEALKSKKAKKENAKNMDDFLFGPGPNNQGVWKYFLRDINKKHVKCTIENCEKVLVSPKGSTSGMRTHLSKRHGVELPSRTRNPAYDD